MQFPLPLPFLPFQSQLLFFRWPWSIISCFALNAILLIITTIASRIDGVVYMCMPIIALFTVDWQGSALKALADEVSVSKKMRLELLPQFFLVNSSCSAEVAVLLVLGDLHFSGISYTGITQNLRLLLLIILHSQSSVSPLHSSPVRIWLLARIREPISALESVVSRRSTRKSDFLLPSHCNIIDMKYNFWRVLWEYFFCVLEAY